mmetsp:Transcript_96297/g.272225  ORF Transcript_96297/g.272225 Transcript_96297/m.272225 type:complete len:344 (-) Transcript_96297:140-1171(-)
MPSRSTGSQVIRVRVPPRHQCQEKHNHELVESSLPMWRTALCVGLGLGRGTGARRRRRRRRRRGVRTSARLGACRWNAASHACPGASARNARLTIARARLALGVPSPSVGGRSGHSRLLRRSGHCRRLLLPPAQCNKLLLQGLLRVRAHEPLNEWVEKPAYVEERREEVQVEPPPAHIHHDHQKCNLHGRGDASADAQGLRLRRLGSIGGRVHASFWSCGRRLGISCRIGGRARIADGRARTGDGRLGHLGNLPSNHRRCCPAQLVQLQVSAELGDAKLGLLQLADTDGEHALGIRQVRWVLHGQRHCQGRVCLARDIAGRSRWHLQADDVAVHVVNSAPLQW